MAKEIMIYGDLYGNSAENVINQLIEAKNSNVILRFNSDGGEIRMGWGIIAKLQELKGEKLFKNDGEANSMAAFAFCYNNNNEAIDTATFGFHRAAMSDWYEKSEYFTMAERQELTEKNAKLREAMEAKMNISIFERITETTLDQIFSLDQRKSVYINAPQALECGLINRVITITPEYENNIRTLAAHYRAPIAAKTETKPNNMAEINSKEALKAAYPELYKQIFAAGIKRGTEKEFDRVSPMLAYYGTNPEKIKAAFESKTAMSETLKMECMQKSITAQTVRMIEGENADPLTTTEANAKIIVDPKKTAATAAFDKAWEEQYKTMYPNSKKFK